MELLFAPTRLFHYKNSVVQLLRLQEGVHVPQPDAQVGLPGPVGDDDGHPVAGRAVGGHEVAPGKQLRVFPLLFGDGNRTGGYWKAAHWNRRGS